MAYYPMQISPPVNRGNKYLFEATIRTKRLETSLIGQDTALARNTKANLVCTSLSFTLIQCNIFKNICGIVN